MKTDSIFYRIFQQLPGTLFELIGRAIEEANNYEFASIEMKQLSFRIDGLWTPIVAHSTDPFYLVEVQFQPEEDLYYRLFGETFVYLRQYRPKSPWRVVAIYPNREVEREELFQFKEMLELSRVTRIYLNELPAEVDSLGINLLKLVIEAEESAVGKAKELISRAADQVSEETARQNFIDLIETIIVYKLPQKSRKEIEIMLGLGDLKQTRFYQEAFADGQQIGQQIGEQIGEQRGEQRGQQIGQQIGERIGEQRGEQRGQQIGEQKAKIATAQRMAEKGVKEKEIAEFLDLPLKEVRKILKAVKPANGKKKS